MFVINTEVLVGVRDKDDVLRGPDGAPAVHNRPGSVLKLSVGRGK